MINSSKIIFDWSKAKFLFVYVYYKMKHLSLCDLTLVWTSRKEQDLTKGFYLFLCVMNSAVLNNVHWKPELNVLPQMELWEG
jgi:hypothetical protein